MHRQDRAVRFFSLRSSNRWRAFAVLGAAAPLTAAVTAAVLIVTLSGSSSSARPGTNAGSGSTPGEITLEGISSNQLLVAGISLTVPPADFAPKVDEQQIAASSDVRLSSAKPGLPIKQTVLAHVTGATLVPPIDRVLWVVSFDVEGLRVPSLGPAGAPEDIPYAYSLVLVDPDTGSVVYSDWAAGLPQTN